jgi:hypothetical protein
MAKTGTCWYVAQLQAGPNATGFATGFAPTTYATAHTQGMELQGIAPAYTPGTATSNVSTAGTYYAKKANATSATCNAVYPSSVTSGSDSTNGFVWGPSFSSPGVD